MFSNPFAHKPAPTPAAPAAPAAGAESVDNADDMTIMSTLKKLASNTWIRIKKNPKSSTTIAAVVVLITYIVSHQEQFKKIMEDPSQLISLFMGGEGKAFGRRRSRRINKRRSKRNNKRRSRK